MKLNQLLSDKAFSITVVDSKRLIENIGKVVRGNCSKSLLTLLKD